MTEPNAAGMLLIVTGTSLRAEEADRPLAYYLMHLLQDGLAQRNAAQIRVRVISDVRWLHEESLQVLPTISLGGPGVNLLAKQWLDDVPLSLAVDERFCIQMPPDFEEPRVSIWGRDNANTQLAVSAFQNRYLPRFLDHCAAHADELALLDPEAHEHEPAHDDADDPDDDPLDSED
jgi:hypothetical protein